MLRSDRPELWQTLFRAFTVAGDGRDEYVWQQQTDAKTDLIIWDSNEVPPADWHAPYWWMRRPAGGIPTNLVAQDNPILVGLKLRQYQQGKVRYWLTDETGRWPFTSVHETRQWFSAWQHSKAPQMDFAYHRIYFATRRVCCAGAAREYASFPINVSVGGFCVGANGKSCQTSLNHKIPARF